MNLFKSKQHNDAYQQVNERMAAIIAGNVVRFQCRIASAMNRWFNGYSVNQKKWILLSFGLLISAALIAGVCSSFYAIPLQPAQHYTSAHIGLPSEIPNQKFNTNQLTDSLTKKSRTWKQQQ